MLTISTKYSDSIVTAINNHEKAIQKPQLILDYNQRKGLIDVCDLP